MKYKIAMTAPIVSIIICELILTISQRQVQSAIALYPILFLTLQKFCLSSAFWVYKETVMYDKTKLGSFWKEELQLENSRQSEVYILHSGSPCYNFGLPTFAMSIVTTILGIRLCSLSGRVESLWRAHTWK